MITSCDAVNLLYRDCQQFGIPVYQEGNIPTDLKGERIILHGREHQVSGKWSKGYIEVNFFVEDNEDGNAELIRLHELARLAQKNLRATSTYDGTPYRYSVQSLHILEEREAKAHYLNAKVMFQSLYTIE